MCVCLCVCVFNWYRVWRLLQRRRLLRLRPRDVQRRLESGLPALRLWLGVWLRSVGVRVSAGGVRRRRIRGLVVRRQLLRAVLCGRLVLLPRGVLGRVRILRLRDVRERLWSGGVHERELLVLSRGHGRDRGQRAELVRLLRLSRGQLQRRQRPVLRAMRAWHDLVAWIVELLVGVSRG